MKYNDMKYNYMKYNYMKYKICNRAGLWFLLIPILKQNGFFPTKFKDC